MFVTCRQPAAGEAHSLNIRALSLYILQHSVWPDFTVEVERGAERREGGSIRLNERNVNKHEQNLDVKGLIIKRAEKQQIKIFMRVCNFFFCRFRCVSTSTLTPTALQPKAASLNPPYSLIKTEGSASSENFYYFFFFSQIFFLFLFLKKLSFFALILNFLLCFSISAFAVNQNILLCVLCAVYFDVGAKHYCQKIIMLMSHDSSFKIRLLPDTRKLDLSMQLLYIII